MYYQIDSSDQLKVGLSLVLTFKAATFEVGVIYFLTFLLNFCWQMVRDKMHFQNMSRDFDHNQCFRYGIKSSWRSIFIFRLYTFYQCSYWINRSNAWFRGENQENVNNFPFSRNIFFHMMKLLKCHWYSVFPPDIRIEL